MRRTVVYLATLGFLLLPTACDRETWRYEMSASYVNDAQQKIGGRYEYWVRAASFSSDEGKFSTVVTTAGAKHVFISVTPPVGSPEVQCKLVVKGPKDFRAKITDAGKDAKCEFRP